MCLSDRCGAGFAHILVNRSESLGGERWVPLILVGCAPLRIEDMKQRCWLRKIYFCQIMAALPSRAVDDWSAVGFVIAANELADF